MAQTVQDMDFVYVLNQNICNGKGQLISMFSILSINEQKISTPVG